MDVLIIGGGIGGLAAALCLHGVGLGCRIYEAAREYRPLGVGINLLPHAMHELAALGLLDQLMAAGIEPTEHSYFNAYGQQIYNEPCGRSAGHPFPQLSIARSALHEILLNAVIDRIGADSVILGHRCTYIEHSHMAVVAHFRDARTGTLIVSASAPVAVAADGFHSVVRKQFYPDEGAPNYSGATMWRGVTRTRPFLAGANVVRAGTFKTGKLVTYPIRNYADGTQLINWIAEIEVEKRSSENWEREGRLTDFIHQFESWKFEWLDVPALFRGAEFILQYPMIDRDPVGRWTFGHVTLLGDAGHPMYPRGGNGAAQAILDASCLARSLRAYGLEPGLRAYEAERRPATMRVVLANRDQAPDTILEKIEELTRGRRVDNLEQFISREALKAITDNYRELTGETWPESRIADAATSQVGQGYVASVGRS